MNEFIMKQRQNSRELASFESRRIRRVWVETEEKWYFSVVDVVAVLTDSVDPRDYWYKMKIRVKEEDGFEPSTVCRQFKLLAEDGKMRETDCANTETLFRIIQSIPSPKAEPFKLWLARVGYERVEESEDPEKAIQRAMNNYLKLGYSKDWVDLRLKSIEIRKDLTNEWQERGIISNEEFAILTDDITLAWAGMKTKDYKKFKDLKKENLRDNMSNLELVLSMLAETSTTEISKVKKPKTFPENRKVAKEGGGIAGDARKKIEAKTGKKVASASNFKSLLEQKKLK